MATVFPEHPHEANKADSRRNHNVSLQHRTFSTRPDTIVLIVNRRIQVDIFLIGKKHDFDLISGKTCVQVFLQRSSRFCFTDADKTWAGVFAEMQQESDQFRHSSYRSFANSELARHRSSASARPRLVFLRTEHFTDLGNVRSSSRCFRPSAARFTYHGCSGLIDSTANRLQSIQFPVLIWVRFHNCVGPKT